MEGSLWVAALKQGRLEGLEIDPITEQVRWGSIYWAKVKTVDAGLDAVFVDLDGKNTGILYNSDVRIKQKDGTIAKGGAEAIGKTFKPGKMVAVQAKTAYQPREYDEFWQGESKIPQVSMDITMPGRFMIFSPMIEGNKISARIHDKTFRKLLNKMLDEMSEIQGCILRAAAADVQTDMLVREGKILRKLWRDVQKQFKGSDAPSLVMKGPNAVQRTLSDQAVQHIERIEIVTMDHFSLVEDWAATFAPDLVTKIAPVELPDAEEDMALFHYRDIMGQIEDLFQPYGLLQGGANIIIQHTAALTAIDVNKGGDKRGNLAVNLEAAAEIARQIRLRNTGGGILIDFMKFQSKKDEAAVLKALERAIMADPCTVQIHGKTALGLVEIARKRRTPPLQDRSEGLAV